MATTSWQLSGDYFETCSCDYVCPCLPTNLAGQMTKDDCHFAFVFHIDQGRYGNVALDSLNFAVVGHAPGPSMSQGNWSVGLILDERATSEQQQAMTAIASGQAGGPMAPLAPLIGKFLGAETKPIRFQKNALSRSVSIPGVLDQAVEGVKGAANPAEPLYIDNTLHPANARLALARAVRSHLHVFGLNWDDTSGQNNGHFAPFNWQS
ncbi:MAG: DUF1326 domain-containing protein [Nitrospinae bacterium]|nr:DUF1326 domain-containing protein [Nitrospinota bacterium]